MELVSYALDFASFLIQNLKETQKIKSIILFGSAVRGEAGKGSDVDLFINIGETNKKLEKEAEGIKNKFFDSVKFKKYWKLLGVQNEINLIVGDLDKWKLKASMLGNSLVLYQSYSPILEKGKNKTILCWGHIKQGSKRVMLNKKIFGYKHYERAYKGLLEEHEGIKLGSNVIAINTENLNIFLKVFHGLGVPVKIIEVFEYSK